MKKIISIILSAIMLLSVLPTGVFAAEPQTAYEHSLDPDFWIQENSYALLDAFCKENANTDHTPVIYYGTNDKGEPMPYYLVGLTGSYLKLVAKECVGTAYFDNTRTTKSSDYLGSDLQTATEKLASGLNEYEKAAIYKMTLDTQSYNAHEPYCMGISGESCEDTVIRPMTTEEASSLHESIRNIGQDYWLCSPGDSAGKAAYVDASGNLVPEGASVSGAQRGVRPVITICSSDIQQISFAVGGKDEKAFLQDTAATNPNNEWKLTILDNTTEENKDVITSSDVKVEDDTVSTVITAEGLKSGGHLVLTISGRNLYMDAGVINNTQGQKISFMLPPFYGANVLVRAFYEQFNGDKKTDVVLGGLENGMISIPTHNHTETDVDCLYLRPGDEYSFKLHNSDIYSTMELKSSNEKVATVSVLEQFVEGMYYGWGNVKALSKGEATVTLTASNGTSDTCRIIVTEASDTDYSVKGISTLEEFEDFALQTKLGYIEKREWIEDEESYWTLKTEYNEENKYIGKTVELKADIGSENGKKVTFGLGTFAGTLNGNGHTVWVDLAEKGNVGLASYNYGEIKDLTVCGRVVKIGWDAGSSAAAGGIVGNNKGTIRNCVNRATVAQINWNRKDFGDYSERGIGGIAGDNAGLIDGCINEGYIVSPASSKYYVGGIVGKTTTFIALVKNCVNAGRVRIAENFDEGGACAGICPYNFGTVHNSINTQPDLALSFNTQGNQGPVVNSYSEEVSTQDTSYGNHKKVYHSVPYILENDTFLYVSPENISAKSGADALVTKLNAYTDEKTGKYPSDWRKWGFEGDNDYPTPIAGTETNYETVMYLDENGEQKVATGVVLSPDSVDTAIFDGGSYIKIVDGELDLTKILDDFEIGFLGAVFSGESVFILKDGAKFVVPQYVSGTVWPKASGITVYAQSTGNNAGEMFFGTKDTSYSVTLSAKSLTVNGGKLTFENCGIPLMELYSLRVNGGEITLIGNDEDYPMIANKEFVLGYSFPNFDYCDISFSDDCEIKKTKGGENYELGTNTTWAEVIAPVRPDDYQGDWKYPTSLWIGSTAEPKQKTEVTFDPEFKVNGGKPMTYGDTVTAGTPTALENGTPIAVQPTVLSFFYENKGTKAAPEKGALLPGVPTDAGNFIAEYVISAKDANYTGSGAYAFSVARKSVTVKADNKTAQTGGEIPELTYTAEGLVGDDKLSGIELRYQSTPDMSATGTYTIEAVDTEDNGRKNYDVTCENGTLTVGKKRTGGSSSVTKLYTVSFNSKGGTAVASQMAAAGMSISAPNAPTKQGFTFTGWYTDSACTSKYDFASAVTASITLYAGWAEGEAVPETVKTGEIILTIGSKDVSVFGEKKQNDVAPIIRNDRTMLPARLVAEALGATVEWNAAERKVTITKDATTIVIVIDSDTAYVNGNAVKLDSPAFIENSRTYTPLRFVVEALGAKVEWNETTRQVTITK